MDLLQKVKAILGLILEASASDLIFEIRRKYRIFLGKASSLAFGFWPSVGKAKDSYEVLRCCKYPPAKGQPYRAGSHAI